MNGHCGYSFLSGQFVLFSAPGAFERKDLSPGNSLAFFILALTSKEIAVSLPFAVVLLACLPAGKWREVRGAQKPVSTVQEWGGILKHAFLASLPFWLALAMYALFRQALLGTAVGGYGGMGLSDLFHSLKIFADKASLIKIFVPVSEEFLPVRALAPFCTAPLVMIVAAFLIRQLIEYAREAQKLAPILAVAGTAVWMALALVPAFQIWHIYPNLVGSRLFFLSSAGLCIVVAILALPSSEALNKRLFCWHSGPGLLALSMLYLVWFYALQINLGAWKQASILVDSFESQLRKFALESGAKEVVILNLPQDYKGAGMLGRKLYLDILNRPPFIGVDLSQRLIIVEPKITGSRDYIWPHELSQVMEQAGAKNVYIWSNSDSTLKHFESVPLKGSDASSSAAAPLAGAFVEQLGRLPNLASGHWQIVNKDAAIVTKSGPADSPWYQIGSAATLTGDNAAGSAAVEIKLPQAIEPLNPNNWLLVMDGKNDQDHDGSHDQRHDQGQRYLPCARVVWSDAISGKPLGQASAYYDPHRGQYLFHLGRYRSFILNQKPVKLSLRFTGNGEAISFKPLSLALCTDQDYSPILTLDNQGDTIHWDASRVIKNAGANSFSEARFFVTRGGTMVDANSELDLYRPAALELGAPDL